MSARNRIEVDVAIIGGGIAGLWLLNVLCARSYDAVLIERSACGDGQTIASQGLIHGGLKYALRGALTNVSEALATMPERWRNCLNGNGEIDLRGVEVLSDRYHMWANGAALGQLDAFLASKLLRGRIRRLRNDQLVAPFDKTGFAGVVYELNELVIDTASLLGRLYKMQQRRVIRGDIGAHQLVRGDDGQLATIRLDGIEISAQRYIFAAGVGNQSLLAVLDADVAMQRRPLHQVILRGAHLTPLYAHCIEGLVAGGPRLTVTTHAGHDGELLWYLGGELASEGAQRSPTDQMIHARAELAACLPWLDLTDVELTTLTIERAEPEQRSRGRPDGAFVARVANLLVCWPTKLTLVPDLADQVLAAIDVTPSQSTSLLPPAPELAVARAPWARGK